MSGHRSGSAIFALVALCGALLFFVPGANAQSPRLDSSEPQAPRLLGKAHFGSSPFDPPEANDTTFVVDQGAGLDTACTFRSGGPLVITLEIDRVVGDVQTLRQNGLISERASLRMPAFDVDFDAVVPGFAPERDRVTFNGNVVPGEFLTGSNNVWKLNTFNVPIEWVEFADDPGANGTVQPKPNTIRIDIDVANSEEAWCTAIDWATLQFEAVRPVVLAHGIFSDGGIWDNVWVPRLNQVGILTDNDLNMGALDSIQNNAGKIGVVVERAKTRWGVDRVNVVAHSKGGLDSRHFAENDDSIDQIVQLGTPNAGSPLADVAQGAVRRLVGRLVRALINRFATPAGRQLTTDYMEDYNASHGSNPKVQYTAMAGDYDPDCFFLNPICKPKERAMLAITGAGDTIVPITSVHALPYTIDRTFASSGDNKEATHSGLHGSAAVYNLSSDRVRRVGRPKMAVVEPSYARTATVGGEIEPGEVASDSIPVERAGPVIFTMMYAGGEAELVLVSPSGERIDPAVAGADADDGVAHDAGEIPGGSLATYVLDAAEAGAWTAEVTGVSVEDPTVPVGYAVHAWIETPAVVLAGSFEDDSIAAGGSLVLYGTLREAGAPLSGATVTAEVALPDGSPVDVPLADDGLGADALAGDGVYSGVLTATSQPGFYPVTFVAEGTNGSGAPFSREHFRVATASASTSSFTGGHRDFGRDTNGNGLYDDLVVEVDLDVTAATGYRLFGVLTDSAGNRHQASFDGVLPVGPATVELVFDGEALFANRVDGPYTLSELRLVEEGDLLLLPVAETTDSHVTAAYGHTEFEHARLRLTGAGTAEGVDLNSNGLYDLLTASVEVEADFAGFYQWSALLVDSRGTEIGFDTGSAFLPAGASQIGFAFDGATIGANGVDGPYFVTSLLLFGAGQSLVAGDVLETPAFAASDFEGFQADSTPPQLTLSADPSVLWPPRHQMVDVTIGVTAIDDVDPQPSVELVSIVSSEDGDGTGDGHTSDDVQDAAFGTDDRQVRLRAERSGLGNDRVYTLTYRARDAAGNTALASVTVVVPHDRR